MDNWGKWMLVVIGSLMALILLLAGAVPLFQATIEHTQQSTIEDMMAYWLDQGYVAYASPDGTLHVNDIEPNDTCTYDLGSLSKYFRNIYINGELVTTGTVTGDLIPTDNDTYDLGSDTNRWKDLYITDGSIYLGDRVISDNGSQLKVDNTFISAPGTPAYMVGANTATDDVPGSTGYWVKSGSTGQVVKTNVDATVNIAYANGLAGGGMVQLTSGNFTITALTIDNCTLTGSGFPDGDYQTGFGLTRGTIITTTGGIQINRGGNMKEVMVHTLAAFNGIAVKVGSEGAGNLFGSALDILDNVYIYGDSYTQGTGLELEYVGGGNFGTIQVKNYAVGVHLYSHGVSYTNGNIFKSLAFFGCKEMLRIETTGTGSGTDGNVFQALSFQSVSGQTTYGIRFIKAIENMLPNVFFWDWDPALFSEAITFDADSNENMVAGWIPNDASTPPHLNITDAGHNNIISPLGMSASKRITVREYGGDYQTLKAALNGALGYAGAGHEVTIEVYGDIVEPSVLEPFPYVNVVGYDATIHTTYATSPVIYVNVGNFNWSNLRFVCATVPQYGCLLKADSSSGGRFVHCRFETQSDSASRTLLEIYGGTATIFDDCEFLQTGTGTSAICVALLANTNPTFNRSKFTGSGTADSYTVILTDKSLGTFNNCVAQTAINGIAPWFFAATSGAILNGCTSIETIVKAYNSDLFDATGLTDSANIWLQPANSILTSIITRLDIAFAAPSITSVVLTLGDGGDPDGIMTVTGNMLGGTVGTIYRSKGAYFSNGERYSSTQYLGYSTAVGANLSTLTAGQITITFICRWVY